MNVWADDEDGEGYNSSVYYLVMYDFIGCSLLSPLCWLSWQLNVLFDLNVLIDMSNEILC